MPVNLSQDPLAFLLVDFDVFYGARMGGDDLALIEFILFRLCVIKFVLRRKSVRHLAG